MYMANSLVYLFLYLVNHHWVVAKYDKTKSQNNPSLEKQTRQKNSLKEDPTKDLLPQVHYRE